MSKFVTYPAVTVLDNDHSLLIDDPNAGTNSITAENAGSTLLSKWAGFETFDEAVQNTIEHNQEFIDRDTAIREETAELKKKIVTTFPSDVSWYVEKKLRAFQSILAGVEDSSTASKNYSANTYLVFNDDIYRVTKAITAGETIEEGVNVTKTTVAEQLLALAQA